MYGSGSVGTSTDPDSQHWYNGISVDKILRHFNLISLNLFQGRKLSWSPPRQKLRSLRRKQLRFFVQVHELLIKNFLCLVCIGFSTFYRSWFIPSYFTQKFSEKISVTDLGSRIWCFFDPWILFRFFWSWIWYSWYGKHIPDLQHWKVTKSECDGDFQC